MRVNPFIVKVLGGQKVLGVIRTQEDLEARILKGLPNIVIFNVTRALKITPDQAALIIGHSVRTSRRKSGAPKQLLDLATGDRLVRASSVLADAVQVFDGDEGKAQHWFHSSIYALGQRKPIDLIATQPGVERVKNMLAQMRYGLYA